jgi:NADPH:quinone reductase-like Zn-dependent oxidoreductase
MLGGSMPRLVQVAVVGGVLSRLTEKSLRVMAGNPTREDLTRLADLVVAGEITAMIDRGYSLDEVPEALKYLGEGHAKGKLVVSI